MPQSYAPSWWHPDIIDRTWERFLSSGEEAFILGGVKEAYRIKYTFAGERGTGTDQTTCGT